MSSVRQGSHSGRINNRTLQITISKVRYLFTFTMTTTTRGGKRRCAQLLRRYDTDLKEVCAQLSVSQRGQKLYYDLRVRPGSL